MTNINTMDLSKKNIICNGSSATASDLIISDAGASYTEQTFTAGKVKISAANVADTSDGTGARTVRLYGLDENYNEIEEDITLNGQTAVLTTKDFIFVYKIMVLTSGSGGVNAGTIYAGTGTVTTGVPATIWLMALAGVGKSRAGFFCVPANKTMIISYSKFNNNTATNACNIKWWSKPLGGSKNQNGMEQVVGMGSKDFFSVYVIPEKTLLWITGNNATSTSTISGIFNYRLVNN